MQKETKEKLIFLAICFFVVILIYGKSLVGDFVFDDRGIIEHQYLLNDAAKIQKILTLPYWTKEAGLYRPATLASYTLNYLLLGSDPAGFHLFNLIFYALTGYLIFLLIGKISGNKFIAYLAAILFLVLPIHTEAVSNIIGRAEILALFFSLLSFLELTRKNISPWRTGLWILLAIGSKETAIAGLPLLFFVIYCREKIFFQKVKKYFYPILSAAIGALIYSAFRFFVLGWQYFLGLETSIVENPLKFAPVLSRIITALKILAIYIGKVFWPFNLCSDYSYNQIPVLSHFNFEAIFGLTVFLFFIATLFIFLKKRPLLSFASAVFIFSFLPVSNLFFPIGTIAGERLMYSPSLGIIIYLAAASDYIFRILRLSSKKIFAWIFLIFICGLCLFYGVLAYLRNNDWLTEKQLFVSASRCAPNSVLSRSNLGAIYYLEGNLAEAKKELLSAQQIYDGYPKGINNLGLVYWKEGNRQKARELFLKALSYRFPYYGAYENLALMALEENNIEEAKKWLGNFYSGDKEAVEKTINDYIESYYILKTNENGSI